MADYSPLHEKLNVGTHFAGFIFGSIAIPALVILISKYPDSGVLDIFGSIAYGIGFLMVFGFSSLYHYHHEPSKKNLMKIWDHISIYYLIAGSYTPLLIAYASPEVARYMLIFLWGLAFLGTIFKLFFTGKFRIISTAIYLAMGWSIVAAPKEFSAAIPDEQFFWIWIGGAFYTIGVVFYLIKKIPYHHAIWHVFVLAGAISHFIGIWLIFQS